jgi:hypothetical protein
MRSSEDVSLGGSIPVTLQQIEEFRELPALLLASDGMFAVAIAVSHSRPTAADRYSRSGLCRGILGRAAHRLRRGTE